MNKSFLLKSYDIYLKTGKLLPEEYVSLIDEEMLSTIDSDIVIFYNLSKNNYLLKKEKDKIKTEERIQIIKDLKKSRDQSEELTIQLQEANVQTLLANQGLSDTLKKLEEQKIITEKELEQSVHDNAKLLKGQGMNKISKIAIWGVIFICITPAIILIIQLLFQNYLVVAGFSIDHIANIKAWDTFENFGIYGLGTLSGLLLGYFGARSFQGSDGVTKQNINY